MSRVYETAIKIGASIAKAFKGDTLAAAKALDKLTSSTKQLKEAEKAAKSFKKLDDAVKASKARYDQASAALKRLEAAERAAGGATKESTRWRKAGEREVANAAREMDRATKAAEKNAAALRKLGLDAARLGQEQKRLHSAAIVASARERLFGAKKDPKDAVPLVHKAGGQIRALAGEAMLLGTAAAGAGVALGGLVAKAIHTGDEIGDTSEKLGITAKALQELRYGAKQSGAETADLDKALGKMLVTVGRFKQAKPKGGGGGGLSLGGVQMLGTGASDSQGGDADPFKKLGLNAKQLAALKPEEQLKKIADGMLKLKTRADRAAVGQAIFGKGAAALDPLFKKGAAGIDEWAKKANKFGGVMSDDAVKAAGEADEALNDLKMAFGGLSTTMGSAFLPTATKVFTQVATWVADNRAQIQAWASNAASWIEGKGIPAFLKVASAVQIVAAKAATLVEWGARLTGGFGNLAIAVGALRLAPLAITLGRISFNAAKGTIALAQLAASTAGGVAPLAVMGATLVTVAAAAAAVGVAIYRIVDAVKELGGAGAVWQDIKDFVASGGMPEASAAVNGTGNAAAFAALKAENERNLALARARAAAQAAPVPRGAGPAGGLTVAPSITIGAGVSRQDVSRGMDDAKRQTLDEWDRRAENRRRLSFAEGGG